MSDSRTGETLPTPPAGTWWQVTGEPQGPWVWSFGVRWIEDANRFAVGAEYYAVASAPDASEIWKTEVLPRRNSDRRLVLSVVSGRLPPMPTAQLHLQMRTL